MVSDFGLQVFPVEDLWVLEPGVFHARLPDLGFGVSGCRSHRTWRSQQEPPDFFYHLIGISRLREKQYLVPLLL